MSNFTIRTTKDQASFWPIEGTAARKSQPKEEVEMTHTHINENVKVYAIYREGTDREFPHGKLRPVMFIWRSREYQVQDVTYVWREIQGQSEVYHFTVSDGASVFELSYNAKALNWTITGTYSE